MIGGILSRKPGAAGCRIGRNTPLLPLKGRFTPPKRLKVLEAPMLDLTYTNPKPKVIAGAKGDWELVIGMEIHAQVASNA